MADTVVWALKTGDMDVVKANLVTVRKPKRVIKPLTCEGIKQTKNDKSGLGR